MHDKLNVVLQKKNFRAKISGRVKVQPGSLHFISASQKSSKMMPNQPNFCFFVHFRSFETKKCKKNFDPRYKPIFSKTMIPYGPKKNFLRFC